jgi:hypothetical protein
MYAAEGSPFDSSTLASRVRGEVVTFAADDVGTSLLEGELDRGDVATLWALVAHGCTAWIEEKGTRTPRVVRVALGRSLVRMAVRGAGAFSRRGGGGGSGRWLSTVLLVPSGFKERAR